ncbi:tryptophan halogenase family protein [Shewanella woodyi]|uniref:tryptophan halogenase family protein n=1 Tax=Shewanella woodyi TaxID=60961 RepID=UPI0007F93453|nr:tryptophan halogenase family protein [Shewanella woodyi]
MKIKRIAIVGAGTAGWLAANHLGSELSADQDVEITVIESKDVPTIGVGEGTVPYIMNSLKRFGISEAELLYSCDTTFKQGIKFVNWLDSGSRGDNFYYHPFDVPYPSGFDVSPYWVAHGGKRPFDDVGIQARICELGLAPKRKSSGEYEGALTYAYHFNALKFAQLLAKNAQKRFNVTHQFATVVGAKKAENGDITHLITKDDTELVFDFYVDCSGFSSILIDKELKVPFVSKADELLTDSVLVQQMPLKDEGELPPYTTATAHSAGWIWDIPLTTRRGTGFVYSSRHMSDEQALSEYADYLGVEQGTISPRKLPMEIGYREAFWSQNCVALGLAQGFVEPLEATSILVTDFSAELLARNFPRNTSDIEALIPHYNKVVTYVWERVVDFIKLHYCISDREDSQFWLDNRKEDTFSDELKQRLTKFKVSTPKQSDFFSKFDLFNDKNFLYVLYGMEFKTKAISISAKEIEHCSMLLQSNDNLVKTAADELLSHKSWLLGLKAAMSPNG